MPERTTVWDEIQKHSGSRASTSVDADAQAVNTVYHHKRV